MTAVTMAGEVLARGVGHQGGWIFFPFFWLLLGLLIFTLIRAGRGWHHGQSAQSVLAERYARGEIAEAEYRERLNVLKRSRRRPGPGGGSEAG